MSFYAVYFPSDHTFTVFSKNNKCLVKIDKPKNKITVKYGTDLHEGRIIGTSSKYFIVKFYFNRSYETINMCTVLEFCQRFHMHNAMFMVGDHGFIK